MILEDIWYVCSVDRDCYPEYPKDKCLVQVCPKGIPSEDVKCEVFDRPIEEFDFWKENLGKEFSMEGVYLDWDKDSGNPIWDLDLIKKRIEESAREKVLFT